jgi:GTPase SAR1 family protein
LLGGFLAVLLIYFFLDLKIVVLGGGGVGKTSFIHRYTCNEFTDTVSV